MNTTGLYYPEDKFLGKVEVDSTTGIENHPLLQLQQQQINISNADIKLQKNLMLPDFQGRFFTQRLYGVSPPYSGFSFSVAVPIAAKSYRNKIKAAQLESRIQEVQLLNETQALHAFYAKALADLEKNNALLQFYERTGLRQADEMIKASTLAYRSGEIGFPELSQFLAQAIDIRKNYLETLNQYNQAAVQFNYYINR
jgi:cobalt-zinc-cadmium resistance protein CzcA